MRVYHLTLAMVAVMLAATSPRMVEAQLVEVEYLGGLTEADSALSLFGTGAEVQPDKSIAAGVAVNQGDSLALVALYNATGGDFWTDNTGWLSAPVCGTWFGAFCDGDGRVVSLILPQNGLSGLIPPEIGSLDQLLELHLGSNGLSGPIPETLGSLARLGFLNLSFNQLSGPIPASLGGLTSLRLLTLWTNQLTGSIPPELGQLSNMEFFELGRNLLTGDIPSQLADLGSNVGSDPAFSPILNLGGNQLTGPIPAEFGRLDHLDRLYLWGNQLTGTIPAELGELTNLRELYLFGNELSGAIPGELGAMTSLERLRLYRNDLAGQIPPELGNLSNLVWLRLFDNQLAGPIPPELGNLENLLVMNLGLNQLSGPIPVSLTEIPRLVWLKLYRNQLTGSIPPEIGNLTNLEWFSVRENDMQGPVPSELGGLERLWLLWLHGNRFDGELPASLADLGDLERLNVSRNLLTGSVPVDMGALPKLEEVRVEDNLLTGLPQFISANLTHLTVQNNRLLFDDLEQNLAAAADSFTYAPQSTFGRDIEHVVNFGEAVKLSFGAIPGTANRYQWMRGGMALPTETDSVLSIGSVALADSGRYVLLVTNDLLPGLELSSATASIRLLNRAPEANGEMVTIPEDSTIEIPVLSNDTDPDDGLDSGSLTIISAARNGLASVEASAIRYVPERDYFGPDSLQYQIFDFSGSSATAWVGIVVEPVNDAPIAVADSVMAVEGTPIRVAVTSNDLDVDGDFLRVLSVSEAGNGSASFDSTGVSYTSDPGFGGIDTVEYTVVDPSGAESRADVRIEVTALRFGIVPLLAAEGTNSTAYAIDEAGTVAGAITSSDGLVRPAIWQGESMVALGLPGTAGQALAIDAGTAVGVVVEGQGVRAAVFGDGQVQTFPSLDDRFSAAYAAFGSTVAGASSNGAVFAPVQFSNGSVAPVSEAEGEVLGAGPGGQMVGWVRGVSGLEQPFISNSEEFRTLDTGGAGGRAFDVLADGTAVGRVAGSGARWSPDGGLTLLNGGLGLIDAFAANSSGWIVGVGANGAAKAETVSRIRDSSFSSVRDLAMRANFASAARSVASAGGRAHIWLAGAATDLNSRIAEGSGWVLVEARGVTESGSVVGVGLLDGIATAFKLEPTTNIFPTAREDVASVESGGTVEIDVVANDVSDDRAELTVIRVAHPELGRVRILGGRTISYKAPGDYEGPVSLTYRVSDGIGGFAEGEVRVEVSLPVPDDYWLKPNHPNPFSSTTTISFGLPESAPLRLDVYDLIGRRVAVLADSEYRAGLHSIQFELSHLPAGTYYYRLSTPSFTRTRSMVLLK